MNEETTEQRIKEEYELTISMMEKQYRELVSKYEKAEAELQSTRAELKSSNEIRTAEKKLLIAEIEAHANTREELARLHKCHAIIEHLQELCRTGKQKDDPQMANEALALLAWIESADKELKP